MTVRPRGIGQARVWTVQALGHDGWVVAERSVDHPSSLILDQVADQLRAHVRGETGWTPTLRVLDPQGRDVSARFRLD
jgi:hypothetical protein